jgi:hypothetical protein
LSSYLDLDNRGELPKSTFTVAYFFWDQTPWPCVSLDQEKKKAEDESVLALQETEGLRTQAQADRAKITIQERKHCHIDVAGDLGEADLEEPQGGTPGDRRGIYELVV